MSFSFGAFIFQLISMLCILGGVVVIIIITRSLVEIRKANEQIVDKLDAIAKVLQENKTL